MHVSVEDLVSGLAGGLGAVHGDVGVAHDLVGAAVAGGAVGDADGRGDEDLVAVDGEGHPEQFLDPLGDVNRARNVVDPIEKDRELVAADAGDGVAGSEVVFEALRDALEQLVAERVAEAVVDVLEAVEVEEENGELVSRASVRNRRARTTDGP